MDRICKDCGKTIIGRTDKKFCDDACRNSFNNKENSEINNYVRNINRILRKNRKILNYFNQGSRSVAHKDDLLKKGFDFNYFTNIYRTKSGKTYFYCYDQGYLSLDNQRYSIVVKKEYVD
ncbi:MAG: hypothetical protein AAF487_11620 [Bacteroidota bacterium]